jgi:DNA-binding transcriptional LysR family regulator
MLIQALESLYGAKLLDRSQPGRVGLTAAGEILYAYAKQIADRHRRARCDITDMRQRNRTDIRIAATATFENHIIPAVVADFHKRNPKIKIEISVVNAGEIFELLQSGDIDIGIAEEMPLRKKFSVIPFLSDQLLLIVHKGHPWSGKKTVSIRKVAKAPLILREEASRTGQIVRKIFAVNGIDISELNIPFVLSSPASIIDTIENKMGISFVSKWAIRREVLEGRLVALALDEDDLLRDFSLITSDSAPQSPAIRSFINYLKAYPYHKKLPSNIPDDIIRASKVYRSVVA